VLASSYGLLDAGAPAAAGLPLLLAGVTCAAAGLVVGHRRGSRSTYRADPWRATEWIVLGCGVTTAALFVVAVTDGAGSAFNPLAWPTVSLPAALAVGVALLPAWLSPAVRSPQ
jgi:energy-coupling factor transport system permease protein